MRPEALLGREVVERSWGKVVLGRGAGESASESLRANCGSSNLEPRCVLKDNRVRCKLSHFKQTKLESRFIF